MRNIFTLAIIGLLIVSCQKQASKNFIQGEWFTVENEENRFFANEMGLPANLVSLEFSGVKNTKGYYFMYVRIEDKVTSCFYKVTETDRIQLGPNSDGTEAMTAEIIKIDDNHFTMNIVGSNYTKEFERK